MKPSELKILVATDFQPQSVYALEYAAGLAGSINAKLILLHVTEEYDWGVSDDHTKDLYRGIYEKLKDKLNHLADVITKKYGTEVITVLEKGKIYKMIPEVSKREKAEMIVMGKKESMDMVRTILGTNTLSIVRSSQIPVITIRKEIQKKEIKKMLLPLDLTRESKSQVANAIKYAGLFNAEIEVLSVLTVKNEILSIHFLTTLNKIEKIMNEHGVKCNTKIIEEYKKDIGDVVTDYANDVNADLIMVMTQKEVNFKEYFVGSNALDIIKNSDLPVLSIIPQILPEEEITESLIDKSVRTIVDPLNIYK